MQIVIQDQKDGTIYTKYQLPNFEFTGDADLKDGTITLKVVKGQSFPTQEDFNRARMR